MSRCLGTQFLGYVYGRVNLCAHFSFGKGGSRKRQEQQEPPKHIEMFWSYQCQVPSSGPPPLPSAWSMAPTLSIRSLNQTRCKSPLSFHSDPAAVPSHHDAKVGTTTPPIPLMVFFLPILRRICYITSRHLGSGRANLACHPLGILLADPYRCLHLSVSLLQPFPHRGQLE